MGIIADNKPFFLFLGKFALSYLVFTGIYMFYLSRFDEAALEPDGMTTIVTKQSAWMVDALGQKAAYTPHPREASYRFFINGRSVARIVEGCNAVSVMVLFAAFIVAFSTTFRQTTLYVVAGVLFIHILNIIRIALITIAAFYYRDYSSFIHDVLFPVFIYGVVFLLWVVWVIKFYRNAAKVKA